jgi:TRAP-type C4-dicarboxylate transport system substrate-binding protein
MITFARRLLAATTLIGVLAAGPVQAAEFIISTGLGKPHLWVGAHMDPFADAIEKASNGEITFTRFYAGELSAVGRELDSLTSGTIQVAAPLLALPRGLVSSVGCDAIADLWDGFTKGHARVPEAAGFRSAAEGWQDILPV